MTRTRPQATSLRNLYSALSRGSKRVADPVRILVVDDNIDHVQLAMRALRAEPSLREYHLLPSVRGDLLAKLNRFAEARAEFERAAALTRNARERELLLERAARCAAALT